MNDINKCFEILGLKPGASLEEVKEAYGDLVKVWHPDRFSHDPKLQAKAQEKLREINEAYQKVQDFLVNLQNYQQTTRSGKDEYSTSDNSAKEGKQETSQAEEERQTYSASQESSTDPDAGGGTNAADLGREPNKWGDNLEPEAKKKRWLRWLPYKSLVIWSIILFVVGVLRTYKIFIIIDVLMVALTYWAWHRGWKWKALIPIGTCYFLAVITGFIGGTQVEKVWYAMYNIGTLAALVIMNLLKKETVKDDPTSQPTVKEQEANFNGSAQSSRSRRYWAIRMAVVIPVACLVGWLVSIVASNMLNKSNDVLTPEDRKGMAAIWNEKSTPEQETVLTPEKEREMDQILGINRGGGLDSKTKREMDAILEKTGVLKEAEMLLAQGKNSFAMKYYDVALIAFTRSIELNPKNVEAYFRRGLTHGCLGNYSQEIKDYNRAIELNPKYALAYAGRGLVYDQLGKQSQAIENWKIAARLGDKSAQEALSKRKIRW